MLEYPYALSKDQTVEDFLREDGEDYGRLMKSLQLGKTLYHQGDLSYFEAVNKETLKNTYQRYEEEGMILVAKSKDSRIPSTLRLADEWTPTRCPKTGRILAQGKLWAFSELISLSRREG